MLKNCPHCGKPLKQKAATDRDESILKSFNLAMCGSFSIEALADFLLERGYSGSTKQGARSSARALLARSLKSVFSFGMVLKEPSGKYRIKPLDNAIDG